jgi:hypothetical protein
LASLEDWSCIGKVSGIHRQCVLELPMNKGRIVPHPAIKNDPCAILTAARQGLLPLGTKRQRRIAYLAQL